MKELFIIAGPNGSGKSTFIKYCLKRYLKTNNFVVINPDALAKTLYKDVEDEKEKYRKAFEIANFQMNEALENGRNILIETVNSSTFKDEFYRKCSNSGYRITVYYIATEDPIINVQRVNARVMSGGHSVPEEKIIARYYRSLDRITDMWDIADALHLYDNSTSEFKLCIHGIKKDNLLVKTIPYWVRKYFIDKVRI